MSCCPTAPEIKVGGSGDEDIHAQDTEIRPGESVECYMRRAGNSTGRMDDKTAHIPGKILNTDIPLKSGTKVNVTFTVTPGSATPSGWSISGTSLPPEVEFDSSGTLIGEFPESTYGKQFKIQVTAEGVDTRGFVFSPQKATGSNEISFVHPLPGAHVTSPFGPRMPPATGASSSHGGADFSLKPLPPGDVLSAADGEVIFTGYQAGGAGKYIKVKHPNAAGRELCTTVYMHLADIYVTTGQNVVAGQKIGKEGNTGIGTGPHLHFECRLPNGTKIDPVPLIRGTISVARETNERNEAKGGFDPSTYEAALTPANVDAKEAGCEPFGDDYPKDPTETDEQPPPASVPIGDAFEKAWFFTMKHEVGPHWTVSSPDQPNVAAGSIETAADRKATGYVNTPNFPGGETKFGIAQGPNPSIKVKSMPYDPAKKTGYNNYWKRESEAMIDDTPKAAIMMFDMSYLHGVGNARAIKRDAGISGKTDDQAIELLASAQQTFMRNIVEKNPNRAKYLNGWLKRSRDLLEYVKSLS